jgi:hypothetical protein
MKKTHKLLSLVLAAAMVCGTCLPVMAAGTTNSTTSLDPKIPVIKEFVVGANHYATEVGFQFTATPATVADGTNVSGLEVYSGPALATPTVSTEFKSTEQAGTDGSITHNVGELDFSGIINSVKKPGVYRYTVSEKTVTTTTATSGGNDHIYSQNPWRTTDVANNGDNTYTVDIYVLNDPNSTTGALYISNVLLSYPEATVKPTSLKFVNVCDSTTLRIEKKVSGNAGDKTKDFQFYICIPEGGKTLTLTKGSTFNATIYNANQTVKETKKITVEGNYTDATGLENEYTFTTNNFTLKDGEYMIIDGVPVGMIYFIREEIVDGYTTTIDYTHTGTKSGSGSSQGDTKTANMLAGQLNTTVNEVVYHNAKDAIVDSGVSVEILPYVLIVAVALAGCLVLLFKKRRTVR